MCEKYFNHVLVRTSFLHITPSISLAGVHLSRLPGLKLGWIQFLLSPLYLLLSSLNLHTQYIHIEYVYYVYLLYMYYVLYVC